MSAPDSFSRPSTPRRRKRSERRGATRPLALLTLLLLLLPAPFAAAFPIPTNSKKHRLSVDLTLTSSFEYHQNIKNTVTRELQRPQHDPEYFDLQNRLNIDITYNQYRFGGRLDTFHFFEDRAPCVQGFDCKHQWIPEKLYLKARFGALEFVAGDFYLTIGRGIALSIRKIDEFGVDSTLRGARSSFEYKDFRATVAAGFVNISNIDPITEVFLKEFQDFIFAANAKQRLFDLFELGLHYVHIDRTRSNENFAKFDKNDPQQNISKNIEYMHIVGGSLDFKRPLPFLDFYFEGNALLARGGTIPLPGTLEERINDFYGYALHANLNLYFFPITIQLEGQWYHSFNLAFSPANYSTTTTDVPLAYNFPPTMERQDLDTQGENSNSKGLRLRIDYTLSPKFLFHANYMFRFGFTRPDFARLGLQQIYIHHGYIGTEMHYGEWGHLIASTGIREITGLESWRLIHADVDFTVQFAPRHSIEFTSRYWWSYKAPEAPGDPANTYHILDAQLSYAFSKIANATFLFAYTDELKADGLRRLFFAGEIKVFLWRFGYIKFLLGQTRGGLRCSSGVCRIFPPFEGFRTELTFRL